MKALQLLLVASVGLLCVTGDESVQQNGKRLIKTSEDKPAEWMTEGEILDLIEDKIGFVDVTDFDYTNIKPQNVVTAIPVALKYKENVTEIIKTFIKEDADILTRIEKFIDDFSAFHNRYYSSPTGKSSQEWLLKEVNETIVNAGLVQGTYNVTAVNHGYVQQSIIARLEGVGSTMKNEVVIIGAHLDSVTTGASAKAPGADDNASGSIVVLETLRAILKSKVRLSRSIEFHFYAAEEIGLRGSQAIAQNYKDNNVNVTAMLNFDVVGYHVDGINDIAIHEDNSNTDVIKFLKLLADAYLDFGRREFECGYGCSDHYSWHTLGFPAGIASEVYSNPHMHTINDIKKNMNPAQIPEYIKLAIGFIIELGELEVSGGGSTMY